MHPGPRQRNIVNFPLDTATVAITLNNCLGARSIVFKIFGGTTSNVIVLLAENVDGDTTSVNAFGLPLKRFVDGPNAPITQKIETEASYMSCGWEPTATSGSAPFPLPRVIAQFSCTVAASNTVTVDAWPVFDTYADLTASIATSMRIA